MTTQNDKYREEARQAWRDSCSQDNEGRVDSVGFIYGYEAGRLRGEAETEKRDAKISLLLNDMAKDTAEQFRKYPTAIPYIMELKEQLAHLRQQLEEAGQLLNRSTNIVTYFDNKTLEDHTFYLDSVEKWLTKDISQGVEK